MNESIDWFKMAYTLLGGLGIFFIGIRTMSESLQLLAGSLIKRIINALTTNRIMAVGVGTLVTTLVQSSSVTTVMVIGFVNAGLMELTQAIGVILGANIGTTITGWIIAINVGKYGLLFVAIGAAPLIFAKNSRLKTMGNLVVSLGFVFMGLKFMSGAFKPLRSNEEFRSLMVYFQADGYLSLLACIGVGMVLTFVIQSSSAMLGITIALGASGAIEFQTAAALVLGENIGTTITALLASIGTTATAKRAARAHAIFNVLGVLWVSSIFWYFIAGVDGFIPGDPNMVDADGQRPYLAAHVAGAHSVFNIANTLLFIPLLGYLARFVTWLTPDRDKQASHLTLLGEATQHSAELSLLAAEKELARLGSVTKDLLTRAEAMLKSDNPRPEALSDIADLERQTDTLQAEITLYVCRVQENRLTPEESAGAYALIRASDELESIADYGYSLARYYTNMHGRDAKLSDEASQDLAGFAEDIREMFDLVEQRLESGSQQDLDSLKGLSERIKLQANDIRKRHRARLESSVCSPMSGMFFSDMIVALRKLRGHIVNLAEALSHDELTDQGT